MNRLLWVDCIGGLLAGALMLVGHQLLSEWHKLSVSLIVFVGVANVSYGSFSLSLAVRGVRPLALIKVLAAANILWMPACIGIVAANWRDISALGTAHLLGEGAYVAGLGLLEWLYRERLITRK